MLKKIAITMGDPGGVGPEVAVKAIAALRGEFIPVLYGNARVISEASDIAETGLKTESIASPEEAGARPGIVHLIEIRLEKFTKNKPTAEGGSSAYECIRRATADAMEGHVHAVVTAPISKYALRMAGLKWPGHTEMLAELTGAGQYAMMLMGGSLRVMLTTIHAPIKNVPGLITREAVLRTIRLAGRACSMLGIESPRIAVCGLNPHAGEDGMFGNEEALHIAPAVKDARGLGIKADGPFPADALFHRVAKGAYDMVVCMYHDQGLIPLKLLAFDTGVNVTVGLPIIRTSPDHGTAYDIAWSGDADARSMTEAVRAALRLDPCIPQTGD